MEEWSFRNQTWIIDRRRMEEWSFRNQTWMIYRRRMEKWRLGNQTRIIYALLLTNRSFLLLACARLTSVSPSGVNLRWRRWHPTLPYDDVSFHLTLTSDDVSVFINLLLTLPRRVSPSDVNKRRRQCYHLMSIPMTMSASQLDNLRWRRWHVWCNHSQDVRSKLLSHINLYMIQDVCFGFYMSAQEIHWPKVKRVRVYVRSTVMFCHPLWWAAVWH